jgi:UDPglucose--hexose-1-phosphate uridylyltransferase
VSNLSPKLKPASVADRSNIRKHYYLDKFVIIAPARRNRPDGFGVISSPHLIPGSTCPFCTHDEKVILALPNTENWRVKVIANAFPALSVDNPKAYGKMEIVIDTPRHDIEFSSLPINHIEAILNSYEQRIEALKQLDGIKYVLAFKNDGPLAGASVAHAHSQIMALPLVPPHIEAEADALNHYYDINAACAVCDLVLWEIAEDQRVIIASSEFIVIAPYASSYPYEVWLIPRRHSGTLSDLKVAETRQLAEALKLITSKLDLDQISFNFFIQESLNGQKHHLLVKIEPRVPMFYGGGEMATGLIINTVAPESVPDWYNRRS